MGIAQDQPEGWAGSVDDEQVEFEIFPENASAVSVFCSMSTQWLWTGGMESHRCGLNHAVLLLHMDKVRVPRKRRFQVMADVQVMERAALDVWYDAAAAKTRK